MPIKYAPGQRGAYVMEDDPPVPAAARQNLTAGIESDTRDKITVRY